MQRMGMSYSSATDVFSSRRAVFGSLKSPNGHVIEINFLVFGSGSRCNNGHVVAMDYLFVRQMAQDARDLV